jgi:pimeloyl-ACP methyl ester carboxylesterase
MSDVATRAMRRAALDGLELEYELQGRGEPVVLVHWGVSAAWAEPLMHAPALGRHRLLNYHRAGFAGSDRVQGPIGVADHASHCARLMDHLGIERAHVVGHSSSALIALQLALDHPEAVRTLALLEPARPVPETELQTAFLREVVAPAVQRHRAADAPGAVDTWCRGVFGPGYREPVERGLPGLVEQAVADADAFFLQELPALQQWTFTEDDAARVGHPTLIVCGEHTAPSFPERADLLASWLPEAERFELPGATHLLHVQEPRAMAEALAAFFARHAAGG